MQMAQRNRDLEQQLKHSNEQLRYMQYSTSLLFRSFASLAVSLSFGMKPFAHLLFRVSIHAECQRPQCIQMVQRIKKLEQDLEHANEKLRYVLL